MNICTSFTDICSGYRDNNGSPETGYSRSLLQTGPKYCEKITFFMFRQKVDTAIYRDTSDIRYDYRYASTKCRYFLLFLYINHLKFVAFCIQFDRYHDVLQCVAYRRIAISWYYRYRGRPIVNRIISWVTLRLNLAATNTVFSHKWLICSFFLLLID